MITLVLLFLSSAQASPPEKFRFGIGLGVEGSTAHASLPSSVDYAGSGFQIQTIGSMRFRLASGLTLEPMISAASGRMSSSTEVGSETVDAESQLTSQGYGLSARPRLGVRGDNELFGIFGASWSTQVLTEDVGTEEESEDYTFKKASLDAGLGIQHWLKPSMSLSAELYAGGVGRAVESTPVGNKDFEEVSWFFELDPAARLLFHLYW